MLAFAAGMRTKPTDKGLAVSRLTVFAPCRKISAQAWSWLDCAAPEPVAGPGWRRRRWAPASRTASAVRSSCSCCASARGRRGRVTASGTASRSGGHRATSPPMPRRLSTPGLSRHVTCERNNEDQELDPRASKNAFAKRCGRNSTLLAFARAAMENRS